MVIVKFKLALNITNIMYAVDQMIKVKDRFDIKTNFQLDFVIIINLLVVHKLVTDKLIGDSYSYFQN